MCDNRRTDKTGHRSKEPASEQPLPWMKELEGMKNFKAIRDCCCGNGGGRFPADSRSIDEDKLPQPLHIYAFLNRSHHFHLGYFQHPGDTVAQAMDQLVSRCIPHFVPRGNLLDIGCGMGGATSFLASRGFPSLGIDPCPESIGFANRVLDHRENLAFAELDFASLLSFLQANGGVFDNIVMIEVLVHFPSLHRLLEGCYKLLRPGGVIVINDITTIPALPWEKVPFHRQGVLCEVALGLGLTVKSREIITHKVRLTLDHLIRNMRSNKEAVISRFAASRRNIVEESDELISQWENLREGFLNMDLAYETVTLSR